MPAATQQNDAHLKGYAQVVALEQQEEERVQQALAKISEEEEKLKREWEEKERAAEAKARSEANEELKSYKDKELAQIIEQGEERTAAERKTIEATHKKQSPAIVKSLVETVLDPSFLS
jgi:hypothetical protein